MKEQQLTTNIFHTWIFRDLLLHKWRIYPILISFLALHSLPRPVPKSVNVWPQLDNTKFPLDFHNYQEMNRLVNSFSNFTITPPNILTLGCKPRWSAKRKKNILLEVAARKCSAKTPSWKFHKIYRKIPVLESSFRRSRRPEGFCKKEVLENSAKFKAKHLCQSLFFDKVAALRCFLWNFIKERPLHCCFRTSRS